MSGSNPEAKYGFFSEKMAALAGTSFWRKPDGTEVEITITSSSPTESGTKWDDVVPLGEIVTCVRFGRRSAQRERAKNINFSEVTRNPYNLKWRP